MSLETPQEERTMFWFDEDCAVHGSTAQFRPETSSWVFPAECTSKREGKECWRSRRDAEDAARAWLDMAIANLQKRLATLKANRAKLD